jgi:hypothetical protein
MSRPTRDLSNAAVVRRLPHWLDSVSAGGQFPDDIIGARIVNFGAAPNALEIEGGSLIID